MIDLRRNSEPKRFNDQYYQSLPTQTRGDGWLLLHPRGQPQGNWRTAKATCAVEASADFGDTSEVYGTPGKLIGSVPNLEIVPAYVDIAVVTLGYNSEFDDECDGHATTVSGGAGFYVVLYAGDPIQKLKLYNGVGPDDDRIQAGQTSHYGRWVSYGWNGGYTGFDMMNEANSRSWLYTSGSTTAYAKDDQPSKVTPQPSKAGLFCSCTGCETSLIAVVSILWQEPE